MDYTLDNNVAMDNQEYMIWHLMAGTKGGPTRLQILYLLSVRPSNTNQIAKQTGLDYKTVKHHLEVLVKNGLIIVSTEKKYGELYYLTEFAQAKVKVFEKIWEKINK